MKHPNRNHIADLDKLMSVLDKRVTQLAYVDKPGAIGAEFNKDSKVGDTDDQGREHGARFEPIHRWDIASQRNRILKITAIGKRELQGSGYGQ